MATYPDYKQLLEGSSIQRLSGRMVDQGGDGRTWIRQGFPVEKFSFTLVHLLSDAEYADLLTFYNANKNGLIDLVWRAEMIQVYTDCLFLDAPQYVQVHRNLKRVTVRLQQR